MKVEVALYGVNGNKIKYQAFDYGNPISAHADFDALTEVFDRFISYRKNLDQLGSQLDPKGEEGGETE